MTEEFKKEVLRICEVDEITPEFSLMENLDSLARAELITAAEFMLGVQISNLDIMSMKTYGDFDQMIKAKL